ncbi:MAG: glycosyltransferase [Bacteroidales bacterium]|nr:glycosyltransferase [Bacteroidales bacterium]
MKFLVVTFAPLLKEGDRFSSYGPYVKEMEMWFQYCDEIAFCCPLEYSGKNLLLLPFTTNDFKLFPVPELTQKDLLVKPWLVLQALYQIYKAMQWADHIHLRCPGNMGLLGAFVQILFPQKKKTAKYAGNWDWNSKQPWSYRLQQRILRNTFLIRNMQVLVYGEWPDRTKNILPFFTASYSEKDKIEVVKPDITKEVRLAFVGTLSANKSPETALQVTKLLNERKIPVQLGFCGDGVERQRLELLTNEWHLQDKVTFLGNVSSEVVKEVLQQAHFLVFISRSEGWPKAVAEAMWWGCVPITTAVSCVPQMLGVDERGFLVENNPEQIGNIIEQIVHLPLKFEKLSNKSKMWARDYTLEKFQTEIIKLL